jgi:hypothetical protein
VLKQSLICNLFWKLEFACVCGGLLFLVVNEFSLLLFWSRHGRGLGGIFEFYSWTGESHFIDGFQLYLLVFVLSVWLCKFYVCFVVMSS